jgi:hypothetical protein
MYYLQGDLAGIRTEFETEIDLRNVLDYLAQ